MHDHVLGFQRGMQLNKDLRLHPPQAAQAAAVPHPQQTLQRAWWMGCWLDGTRRAALEHSRCLMLRAQTGAGAQLCRELQRGRIQTYGDAHTCLKHTECRELQQGQTQMRDSHTCLNHTECRELQQGQTQTYRDARMPEPQRRPEILCGMPYLRGCSRYCTLFMHETCAHICVCGIQIGMQGCSTHIGTFKPACKHACR